MDPNSQGTYRTTIRHKKSKGNSGISCTANGERQTPRGLLMPTFCAQVRNEKSYFLYYFQSI